MPLFLCPPPAAEGEEEDVEGGRMGERGVAR